MTYDELLAQHPDVRADADKIAGAVKTIVNTAKSAAGMTVKLTSIFMALVPMVTTMTTFLSLGAEGKALVFAEAFDAAIGEEDTALVTEFMIFGVEETEEISDSMKKVVFRIFHKKFLEAEAIAA